MNGCANIPHESSIDISSSSHLTLKLASTPRFQVLTERCDRSKSLLLSANISLDDLLLCCEPTNNSSALDRQEVMANKLYTALNKYGFCLIGVSANSRPGQIIQKFKTSLEYEFFPTLEPSHDHKEKACSSTISSCPINTAGLRTSNVVYFSEKNIPMYRLGYECCQDGGEEQIETPIREVFRVAMNQPDDTPWLNDNSKLIWLTAAGFMRHVTDLALDLLIQRKQNSHRDTSSTSVDKLPPIRKTRPYSGRGAWDQNNLDYYIKSELIDRYGDYSMLYAMHYFPHRSLCHDVVDPVACKENIYLRGSESSRLAVKAHVDPGLLVIEPFLCEESCGLQVWDKCADQWIDCDGPDSLFCRLDDDSTHYMLMFAGKALTDAVDIPATVHRVVECSKHRKTIIYEQKYEEFFPPPTFD